MNANPLRHRVLQSLALILVLAATATAAEARMGTPGTSSPGSMNAPGFGQMKPAGHTGGWGYGSGYPPPYAPPTRQRGSSEPSGGGGTKPVKKPNLQ